MYVVNLFLSLSHLVCCKCRQEILEGQDVCAWIVHTPIVVKAANIEDMKDYLLTTYGKGLTMCANLTAGRLLVMREEKSFPAKAMLHAMKGSEQLRIHRQDVARPRMIPNAFAASVKARLTG